VTSGFGVFRSTDRGFLVLEVFRSTDRRISVVLLGFLGFSDQIDREGDRRWVFRSD
jgi:hypothetical protein